MHSYRYENIFQAVKKILLKCKNVYEGSNTVIVLSGFDAYFNLQQFPTIY